MKYYNNKNLINDNILNNIVKIKNFIDKTKNDYIKIINSKNLINKYANEVYSQEYKKGYKVDLDYINYVLNDWILDFKLSKKEKKIIEKNIK